jgi:hypothetical protein
MTVSLDDGEYILTSISPEIGNEARLHDWGMSNSVLPVEDQTDDHYIKQHFGIVPVSEMRKWMKFIAFKTVEGINSIRLGSIIK